MRIAGFFCLDENRNIIAWVDKKEIVAVGSIANTPKGQRKVAFIVHAYMSDTTMNCSEIVDIEWRDKCQIG